MNKVEDNPEPKWWSEFGGIVYPQWAPALVWRALMRLLPSLLAGELPPDLQSEMATAGVGILKILMRYPFVLDDAYRSQRTNVPRDARQIVVVEQFQKLFREVEPIRANLQKWEARSGGHLFESMFAMFQAGANASSPLSQAAMKELSIAASRLLRPSWDEAVEIDLRALYPLDEEKIDDLKELLESPLWPGTSARDISSRREWFSLVGAFNDAEAAVLSGALALHMAQPLEWDKVLDLLSRPVDQTLTEDQATQIQSIAADRVRVATLLARMALHDRTRLDLAAAPSVAGFREAMEKRGLRRAELPALEQQLVSVQKEFTPNPTWLAWVQTVHSPGLESIMAEMKSWLPGVKASSSVEPKPTMDSPPDLGKIGSSYSSQNARPDRIPKSANRPGKKQK